MVQELFHQPYHHNSKLKEESVDITPMIGGGQAGGKPHFDSTGTKTPIGRLDNQIRNFEAEPEVREMSEEKAAEEEVEDPLKASVVTLQSRMRGIQQFKPKKQSDPKPESEKDDAAKVSTSADSSFSLIPFIIIGAFLAMEFF